MSPIREGKERIIIFNLQMFLLASTPFTLGLIWKTNIERLMKNWSKNRTRWLKSSKATPNTIGSFVGAIMSDSGRG